MERTLAAVMIADVAGYGRLARPMRRGMRVRSNGTSSASKVRIGVDSVEKL